MQNNKLKQNKWKRESEQLKRDIEKMEKGKRVKGNGRSAKWKMENRKRERVK